MGLLWNVAEACLAESAAGAVVSSDGGLGGRQLRRRPLCAGSPCLLPAARGLRLGRAAALEAGAWSQRVNPQLQVPACAPLHVRMRLLAKQLGSWAHGASRLVRFPRQRRDACNVHMTP